MDIMKMMKTGKMLFSIYVSIAIVTIAKVLFQKS